MTTLQVLLHVAPHRDYELHSLDFSTAFLHGSLHEEIWLRRPLGFTGTFPPGTQWSLRRPVYGLRQAPREWHDTLRTTLAALGFAPSTADPSLFLRTDTLCRRSTSSCTRDTRAQIWVLQRFGFTYSSTQATPLPTRHSLSALPSDESVESSGPYPELVGCLMYLMTCTRPDLAYPLSILARYVAPGRHRPEHMAAAKRVLCYLCSTSGMGLVLGGRSPVVLTGQADASWADDQATQRSSQGYSFSLGSSSVSWRATRSSSVLGSSCEAEIYAGAMAAQELCWLTYLLTDLGEPPRSPPVLYQRGLLRLAYVASEANTADVFTKALAPCDYQRFCTQLACFDLPYLTGLFDEFVSYHARYPCRGLLVSPPPLFLAPNPPPPVPPVPSPPGPAPSGASHTTPLSSVARQVLSPSPLSSSQSPHQPLTLPRQVAVNSGGVGVGGASTGGADSEGAGAEGDGVGGASSEGAEAEGVGAGGAISEVAGAKGTGTGGASFVGAGAEGTGTRGASFGGSWSWSNGRGLQTLGLPSSSLDHSPPPTAPGLPPSDSSLAIFSPPRSQSSPPVVPHVWIVYCPARTRPSSPFVDLHHVLLCSCPCRSPPQSVLLSLRVSSLTASSFHPITDYYRTARPIVSRLLVILITDPTASPSSVSALIASVSDFSATRCLEYVTRVVAAHPLSTRGTYVDTIPLRRANVVDGMWIFKVKRLPGSLLVFKRDYKVHSQDFSTAFLQGRLHEEIWLCCPSSFTSTFPPGTQWSLRRPVYGLRQAPPREPPLQPQAPPLVALSPPLQPRAPPLAARPPPLLPCSLPLQPCAPPLAARLPPLGPPAAPLAACAPLLAARLPPLAAACPVPCAARLLPTLRAAPLWLLSTDSVSLFDHTSGASPAPPATADSATRSQWLTRDAAARIAICNHLPLDECAHFGQHRIAQALCDAVVAHYSSPATAALGRLLLPYLFPELSAFATVEDLVAHLRTRDAR
ncbi:unnamed protein product [Closterium sp. NIES-53]